MNVRYLTSLLLSLLCVLLFSSAIVAQEEPLVGQHPYPFEGTKLDIDYLLYLPENYNDRSDKEWPLIVYFHGSSENSSPVESIRQMGLPKKLEEDKDFPFIVVSPHFASAIGNPILAMTYAVDRDEFVNLDDIGATLETVIALIDATSLAYRVDKARIYATGISQGGYFAWFIATAFPDRFAAIAPVAGSGIVERACELKTMPIWIFHGALDTNVLIKYAEKMVNAIEACGGSGVQMTVYPDWGHDSRVWDATYNNPELYTWFRKNLILDGVHTSVQPVGRLISTWGKLKQGRW